MPLTVPSSMSNNISYSEPNAITIIQPGVYRVDAMVSGYTPDNANVLLIVLLNGDPIVNMVQALTYDIDG